MAGTPSSGEKPPACGEMCLECIPGGTWQDRQQDEPDGETRLLEGAGGIWTTTPLSPRGYSGSRSRPQGTKSDSPLPKNNSIFRDPFPGRQARDAYGLSKARPASQRFPPAPREPR